MLTVSLPIHSMDYFEYEILIHPFSEEKAEILVAKLSEIDFESFEITESGLKAYIPKNLFSERNIGETIENIQFQGTSISYNSKIIKAQNWNTIWESNFEPIYIEDKIMVRAPFHKPEGRFKHEIIIEPKMSFGTGHHETTSLMMEQMLNLDFNNKTVLDIGCGTGILAILAAKLGAKDITAIDFDEWAYENSIENFERNKCSFIKPILGDATKIPDNKFDVILANINRNVLLTDIKIYSEFLKPNGHLILSGFYNIDVSKIKQDTEKQNLIYCSEKYKNNWAVCSFIKM
jgi:ribosomal protein L11 methyltransferase